MLQSTWRHHSHKRNQLYNALFLNILRSPVQNSFGSHSKQKGMDRQFQRTTQIKQILHKHPCPLQIFALSQSVLLTHRKRNAISMTDSSRTHLFLFLLDAPIKFLCKSSATCARFSLFIKGTIVYARGFPTIHCNPIKVTPLVWTRKYGTLGSTCRCRSLHTVWGWAFSIKEMARLTCMREVDRCESGVNLIMFKREACWLHV